MKAADSKTYDVQGMTCGHCEAAIAEEVGKVRGVTDVRADRKTGTLLVAGDSTDDAAVRAAVVEAGYEIGSGHLQGGPGEPGR